MSVQFNDVGRFHRKFLLEEASFENPPHLIPKDLQAFRLKFLHEELRELTEAYAANDLPKIADALIDLVYVAMGTAHLHNLPWDELWNEVQAANMRKERCEIDHTFVPSANNPYERRCSYAFESGTQCGQPPNKHSFRGSINDVIKPLGWEGPDIDGVLKANGYQTAAK
jgi:predicted HAD superfamily Cof-like phosphohydrolase